MDLKEFRIGNYIYQDPTLNGNDFCVVVAVNEQHLRTASRTLEGVVYTPTPIPLTEEWLLKAGFKLEILHHPCYTIQAHTFDWELLYVTIMENNLIHFGILLKIPSSEVLTVGDKEYPTNQIRNLDFCFNLKYVHQLQNLYFSITGKELEFKSVT